MEAHQIENFDGAILVLGVPDSWLAAARVKERRLAGRDPLRPSSFLIFRQTISELACYLSAGTAGRRINAGAFAPADYSLMGEHVTFGRLPRPGEDLVLRALPQKQRMPDQKSNYAQIANPPARAG